MNDEYRSIIIESGIKTVIVEDEQRSQETLVKLLRQYCPQVKVVGTAGSEKEAISLINQAQPELIFLDIALPDGDGFNVLENIDYLQYKVIFVTAYDNYAIRAFEFSALHYLLKPISHVDLQVAVKRYQQEKNRENDAFSSKISTLRENINNNNQKLMLPTLQGFEIIELNDIVRLEASHNYTTCFLKDKTNIVISKPLINFESVLTDLHFARVHNKHLVNLKYVKKYMRGSGGSLKMADDSEIAVSKGRKAEFIEKLNDFAHHL
ncbi:MAG: response regulator transcription factor [Bacteroidales bacterium]|nr:response regulator transcription factor [Bacteroidales bacterium]